MCVRLYRTGAGLYRTGASPNEISSNTHTHTGTFRDVQSAGDLRLDDIPKLLHEYKRLCKLVEKRLPLNKTSEENYNNGDGDDLLVGLLD